MKKINFELINDTVDEELLEKDIQRIFKKLPRICSDINVIICIIEILNSSFNELFGRYISGDY